MEVNGHGGYNEEDHEASKKTMTERKMASVRFHFFNVFAPKKQLTFCVY